MALALLTSSCLSPARLLLSSSLSSPIVRARRLLTSSEVSTALRPFYFLVHPDLFGRFPDEREVNEKSLKTLRAYVDGLVAYDGQRRPGPAKVKFYIKPRGAAASVNTAAGGEEAVLCRSGLRSVTIRLDAARARDAVKSILKEVKLPTSYLDSIPQRGADPPPSSPSPFSSAVSSPADDPFDLYSSHLFRHELRPSTDTTIPLAEWLGANISTARERIERAAPLALRAERVQDEICREFGLAGIAWDCDWNKEHRLAALNSFRNLISDHASAVAEHIDGRVIVFGRYSGVSLDGHIVLFSGEVRSNWLNVIKRVPLSKDILGIIPFVEKSLSQAMRDIQVVRRQNQPITLVEDYRSRLRQLLTILGDYRSASRFPDDWPESMSEFKLCVETEASPLMLTPDGVFVVPANCPAFLLVKFFSDHLAEAREKMAEAEQARGEEESLTARCSEELGLIELGRADGVDAASMIECCVRLLQEGPRIRHLTHGNSLLVAKYYSVLADGVVCVPWNWVD